MWSRVVFAAIILGLQILAALILTWGLRLPSRWALIAAAAFILFNLPLPYLFWLQAAGRQPSFWTAALIVRPCFAWAFNWLAFLFFLAPIIVLARVIGSLFGWEALIAGLRYFMLSIIAGWGLLTVWGLATAGRAPEISAHEITIPGLPPEQSGIRLVQLTDPHIGWWNSSEELERVSQTIAGLKPDLLVLTGDMVDHNLNYATALVKSLDPVRPRLGRYAIIGNHDVYTGKEAVAQRMEAGGFRMLRNQWISLEARGARLVLAGYDDSGRHWTGADPDERKIPELLADVPAGLPVILLAHRPSAFDRTEGLPVVLTLSGHTHGGQLRLPFGGPGLADLGFQHPSGLFRRGNHTLYANRGTGTVGWPFRLFCPSEVALFILRSPAGS